MFAVGKVSLNVRDQDAAKRFWLDVMGFDEVMDAPMGAEAGDARWIEVRSPGDGVTLVLFTMRFDEDQAAGRLTSVIFECDDILATYRELEARGVAFVDEPVEQAWGWWASFKDNEGNVYGLGQR